MATVIDYAGGVPAASAVKAAGHVGAVRYLSPPRPGSGLAGKPISRQEVEDYDAHGLDLAFVWQYGKEDPDVMRGARGGELDAKAADEALRSLGRPGAPVFFAVDFDISLVEWNSTAVDYFRAAVRVLGRDRVGIYGHSRVVHWAMEDGVVADLGGGRVLGWVTRSWGSRDFHDYAVLYQRIVDTRSTPGPKVGGVVVDVNDVLHDYWGQSPPPRKEEPPMVAPIKPNPAWRGDPTFLPEVLRAFGVEVVEFDGWKNRGQGDFTNIEYVMVHHTGGPTPDPTPPSVIAYGHSNLRGLLSQIHLGKTGVATIVGAGLAYHAGLSNSRYMPGYVDRISRGRPTRFTRGNAESIGIEAQNSGSEPYPPKQLDAYHRTVAAILWFLGHDSSRGIGHKEYAPGRKVDPALNMDEFRAAVQRYIDYPPFASAGGSNDQEDDMFTDEDRAMLREIYNRETARVRSTYVDPDGKRSNYHGDREAYLLDDNRKIEDVHANMLPAMWARLLVVEGMLRQIIDAIQKGGQNDGK